MKALLRTRTRPAWRWRRSKRISAAKIARAPTAFASMCGTARRTGAVA